MLKGIIFDLDGVITDTAAYHFLAWKELAIKFDINLSQDFNENLKGISRMESLNRILKLGDIESKFTIEEKRILTDKKNAYFNVLIDQLTPNDFLPGIDNLLIDLKEKNYKLSLASASNNAPKILMKLNIFDVFDSIIDPLELRNGKPNPEIFLKAANSLSLEVHEVVGIEDAISGIDALNSANIFSIGVGLDKQLNRADVVVPETSYLTLDFIEKQFNSKESRRKRNG